MWTLKRPTDEDLKLYCNLEIKSTQDITTNRATRKKNPVGKISIESNLLWRVENCDKLNVNLKNHDSISKAIKNSILKDKVHDLLVSDYTELPHLEECILKDIISKINKVGNYKGDIMQLLSVIFDYDTIISNNKSISYKITDIKGNNTCTYCNRLYTNTVFKEGREYIVRPDLDHWLCKSKHPLLALSFYNLIPSCPICNRNLKGGKDFNDGHHIHPYCTNKREFRFCATPSLNNNWNLKIKRKENSPEDYMIKDFKLEEVYKDHAMKEVKELIDFAESNNNTYLEDLYENILSSYPEKTQEEVYKMLFGTELYEKDFLNRPLSKLKYDILIQLDIIKPIN